MFDHAQKTLKLFNKQLSLSIGRDAHRNFTSNLAKLELHLVGRKSCQPAPW